jgi:hypothetical protein
MYLLIYIVTHSKSNKRWMVGTIIGETKRAGQRKAKDAQPSGAPKKKEKSQTLS